MARDCAITVGINKYSYLRSLNYAMRDADAMHSFFSMEMGFDKLYHFTDESQPIPQDYGPDHDSRPTGSSLRRFLRERFNKPFLRAGDNLWFFFAGHGIRYEGRDYLMPIDADPEDLDCSAIPIQYVSERLRRSGADNIILLIDACRSYEGRRGGIGIGKEKQQGVITLFSCSPEESSYEIQELEQGAFTYTLLDSLRIQGEGNCATVERLYQRLRYHVPQITQRYKRVIQTPYGVIEPLSKSHLILLSRQATLDDVRVLKNDALIAEVQRRLTTARQLWIRVLAVSPADSEAIEGIERIQEALSQSTLVSESLPISRVASRASTSRHFPIERISDALSTHRKHIRDQFVSSRERMLSLMLILLRVVRHPIFMGLVLLLLTVPALLALVNLSPLAQSNSRLETSEPPAEPPATVPGEITLSINSDTDITNRISRDIEEIFEAEVEGIQVISNVRSNAVQALIHKGVDLAAISRPLTAAEKATGLTEVPIIEEIYSVVYMGEASPTITAFLEFANNAVVMGLVPESGIGSIVDSDSGAGSTSSSEEFERIMQMQEEQHQRRLEEQREPEGKEPVEGTGKALQKATDEAFPSN